MEYLKTHIYFVPGLAASPKIFEYLNLSKTKFELHFLEWLIPLSKNEPLENYAKRMASLVIEKKHVLVGVSFGGIVAQEMSKHLNTHKIIIISSVKSKNEYPKRLKLIQKTKSYKLIPTKIISNFEKFSVYVFGNYAKQRVNLYKKYLSVRNEKYLNWAIYNVLNWQQSKPLENIIHIHGNDDPIFPIKHIENCIPIKKGTHAMILYKAKTISKIISNHL